MPAPLLSQPSARTVPKAAAHKPRAATAPPKKRRVVRRRGRGRGELDSDDEIEREVATDTESDDDDLSSSGSATDDSDTEPASEDVVPHDRAHLPTPRNSKSPESVVKEEKHQVNSVASFFAPSANWSEMVADENVHGPADLPVIEFADFGSHPVPQNGPGRKLKKASKSNRPPEPRATPAQPTQGDTAPPVGHADSTEQQHSQPRSAGGQSARQAYQHKLETDPSFVPTIGNFWGHDDRLIDTELRSLSGWWRGRGRGRGRGFMRGRGGFQGRPIQATDDATANRHVDLPPIDRPWTHDGFEDMKTKEERRRAEQAAARQEQPSPRRGGFVGSRGGFVGRGRGGFMRGGFDSPVRARNISPFMQPNRVRFLMKPELMWTKQHEAFLYFDTTLKPRPGQGPGFRVKVPGHQLQIIRAPPASRIPPQASTSKVTTAGAAIIDGHFVVRMPKRAGKEKEGAAVDEKVKETPIEEVFTVRPQLVAANPIPLPEPTQSTTAPINIPAPSQQPAPSPPVQVRLSESTIRSQLEQLSLEPQAADPERQAQTEQAVLRQVSTELAIEVQTPASPIAERPTLPHLQTAFTPPISQPSPAYGSLYGYPPPLPLGIAMNQLGMPYEVATGRPVYLQAPAMYNPQPMMPSHLAPAIPFVSAVSPDFLSQPPSHTPPMNGFIDPATGTPIFSFPRQTSRIEIRAPTEEPGKLMKPVSRTPSGLRTSAPTFQPSRSTSNSDNGYYNPSPPSEASLPAYDNRQGSMEDVSQAGMAGMMPYQPYQQPYYYPEPYGYPQYMDMSQTGQYDVYGMDQVPQGTVYY